MSDWHEFLANNEPKASAPVPSWAHLLVRMVGELTEHVHELQAKLTAMSGSVAELHGKVDEALPIEDDEPAEPKNEFRGAGKWRAPEIPSKP